MLTRNGSLSHVTTAPLLPTRPFAEAKAKLSDLMSEVVHDHRPVLLDRHRGKEEALVVSVEDLAPILEVFTFDPQVSVSEGEFVMRLPELNLISKGPTFDDALAEMVELVETYAGDYFNRFDFYRHTDRRRHLPWLLRFALTPAAERAQLLVSPAPSERPALQPA
jgi:prevent-host-death family protein